MMRIKARSRHVKKNYSTTRAASHQHSAFGNESAPSRYLNSGGLGDGLQKTPPHHRGYNRFRSLHWMWGHLLPSHNVLCGGVEEDLSEALPHAQGIALLHARIP
jgi:hypothetical protein